MIYLTIEKRSYKHFHSINLINEQKQTENA